MNLTDLIDAAGLAILGYLAHVVLDTRVLVRVLKQKFEDHLDQHQARWNGSERRIPPTGD